MADSSATKKAPSEGNYKETIESILIAFILAFIFRAFVVEAFVIPTGSMAPTLYGAHMRYHCPDCGYVFDAGYRAHDSALGDDVDIPSTANPDTTYHCPNCGFAMPDAVKPVRFGDRILVLKYLYLASPPKRWDVVVFKSPDEREKHNPIDPEYSQNYIKRLVGIGPESLVILDGDVYCGALDAEAPVDKSGKPLFTIQRKPNYVQDALWRVVYANDFIPHLGNPIRADAWTQPWQEEMPGSGWTVNGPPTENWPAGSPSRVFSFSDPKGGGAIVFNPDVDSTTHALTDFLVYDEAEHRSQGWEQTFVSDLKLSCYYTRKSGDGPVRLQMSKNTDVFTAELTRGQVKLLKAHCISPDRPDVIDEHLVDQSNDAAIGSQPVHVELINVDYRVSVRINGREVLATKEEDYHPDVAELWSHEQDELDAGRPLAGKFSKPMVRMQAQGQTSAIEHLVLSRDIQYLNFGYPLNYNAVLAGTTRKVVHLKAGEYFTMGDNSFISGDARYWGDPIRLPREDLDVDSHRVPERFMLGKAFFVYWPAGYPLPYLNVNAVPDFGEMRSIR